jgi:acyl carrier protein
LKDIQNRVEEILEEFVSGENISGITLESLLKEDLNFDSLDSMELIISLEEEFDILILDEEAEYFITVQDLIDIVTKKKAATL